MRWPDEVWIKLYTRDEPDWMAMSWQARGLFVLLMRAVDRAGILSLKGKQKLKAVAVTVRAQWMEIEAPLQELLDDGCVRYSEIEGKLWIPNFVDAQTSTMSDVGRKRKSRLEAVAGLNGSRHVTSGHETAPIVTNGHVGGEIVTAGHDSESVSPLFSSTSTVSSSSPVSEPVDDVDDSVEPKTGKRKKGHRLPDDWQPSKNLVETYRAQGFDALASLKRFRNHWLSTTKNATKLDWDRTFENWIDSDIEKGVAKKISKPATNGASGAYPVIHHVGKKYSRQADGAYVAEDGSLLPGSERKQS